MAPKLPARRLIFHASRPNLNDWLPGDSRRPLPAPLPAQGGINAGLRATVWINPAGKARKIGDPVPSHVVKTIGELPGIVDAMLLADS